MYYNKHELKSVTLCIKLINNENIYVVGTGIS
jgi:hypothetical protein